MKKNDLQISIPTPCHENWDAMTPTEIGKFCSSCQKEVIDFSRMSDEEIRKILNSSKETPCGRFNQNQLERPLVAILPVNRSLTWIKYAASLFLAFQGTNAISQTTNTTISPKDDVKVFKDSIKTIEISGFVLDSLSKNGIFDAKVYIKRKDESIYICRTDYQGQFTLNFKVNDSIENYIIHATKKIDGYNSIQFSLSDFLKTKTILLSKDKSITSINNETEVRKIMGDIAPTYYPKRTYIKKWYQFWKK